MIIITVNFKYVHAISPQKMKYKIITGIITPYGIIKQKVRDENQVAVAKRVVLLLPSCLFKQSLFTFVKIWTIKIIV